MHIYNDLSRDGLSRGFLTCDALSALRNYGCQIVGTRTFDSCIWHVCDDIYTHTHTETYPQQHTLQRINMKSGVCLCVVGMNAADGMRPRRISVTNIFLVTVTSFRFGLRAPCACTVTRKS